jgi:DNA-binding CsgD family transcriptional regulator
MLFSDGLIDSAYTEYQNIIILNEEQNIGLDLESAFANLAEIEYRKGNLETYRSYSQRAKLISDSLLKLVNNNTISIIEIRNKYRFKQNELTLANERVKIKSRAKTIWIIVISSLLTLSLILAYIIYKSRKLVKDRGELNQLKLEQDLELKQKELTLSVMGQIKQNTTLDNLSDLIQKIDEEAPSRLKPKLQRAKRILKHDSKGELWKEFETRFTSVHADFYERLKNLGPELSPAEVKVCAFLKLGLNTKEIASLLHKTPASIEVDRSRIRKKLGLTSQEVNLTTFIQEI